jgi:predicted enzyme related to lactoylglutathione lyase
MIANARAAGIYVTDQDRALAFYTGKLGFEVRTVESMGPEMGDARWIEVAPKGAETVFYLFTPPGLEDQIGGFSNIIFEADDFQATVDEMKAKGVEFTQEPSIRPWGPWAQFKDPDGNEFGLGQTHV